MLWGMAKKLGEKKDSLSGPASPKQNNLPKLCSNIFVMLKYQLPFLLLSF